MIKPLLYLRDSAGQFISKPRAILKVVYIAVAISAVVYLITLGFVKTWVFANTHGLQSPRKVTITKQEIFPKLPERTVLSPVVSTLAEDNSKVTEEVAENKLTAVEKILLEVFGVEDFKMARAVAKAESGLREDAFHANTNGTIDVGIFQINSIHFGREGCSFKELVNMESNIKCAKKIYDEQGWGPWVVFNTGAFKGNL
jgi:hypothetical protein